MNIKIWNNYDRSVFRLNPILNKTAERIRKRFSPEENKQLQKISREFCEEAGLEFVHNLKPGWENKLLKNGKVLSRDGRQELKTKEEIEAELLENGMVQFHHRRKNSSFNFIAKEVKKPAHLCWG